MSAVGAKRAHELVNAAPAMDVDMPASVSLEDQFSPELLRVYYGRLFPFTEMTQWLGYSTKPDPAELAKREFSFTLENDIYIRYQSFDSQDSFKSEVVKRNPFKMDIGAVYNAKASLRTAMTRFYPVERELVFDIDMTDYDDVRSCCSGASVCDKCWSFMTAAIQVLDAALTQDFGFKHILWVFSGRRGIHCWVCDEHVRKLDDEQRSKLVEYFNVFSGAGGAYVDSPIHPSLVRAFKILNPIFKQYVIEDQELFRFPSEMTVASPESGKNSLAIVFEILGKILGDEVLSNIQAKFERSVKSPVARWEYLVDQITKMSTLNTKTHKKSYRSPLCAVYEILFTFLYPRLDINVSKSRNHLLKSPFVVHPKTGKVCIPIDPATCAEFDPTESVPTLQTLMKELNAVDQDQTPEGAVRDNEKTSLAPSVKYFKEKFLKPLLSESLQAKRQQGRYNFHELLLNML